MRVVIIGAGFGGIAAAIEFVRSEITDVTILEQAPDFGGTWLHNSYPGTACDQSGRIVANWPGYMREYVQRTREFDPAEYRFVEPPARIAA
jgi:cation diffusion facilitator CzcD-associated flavoprotein CzcO